MSNHDLREVMRKHAIPYLEDHREELSLQQKRVIYALARCQTGELGRAVYACDD
jgi:hypothetical protein